MWARELIDWFRVNQRSMPWRENVSPYYTLISEFMAQQTQIITVIPYFNQWIQKFPTIEAVANASEDSILKSWEGLGYYSRARNLHKTAKIICNRLNGKIPNNEKALQKLPGIGPYIAAAVASIAFNETTAVVDGNVLRVITRFFGIKDDITKDQTKEKVKKRLDQIIKTVPPSDFNQGLMELGALICKPKSPKCMDCPISDMCYAKNMNEIERIPVKPKKEKIPHYTIVVGIIKRVSDQKVLITKRKSNQLLGGLWEFPGGKVNDNETLELALQREIKEEVNLDIKINSFLCKVNHAYSHFKITMHAYLCNVETDQGLEIKSAENHCWIDNTEFDSFAFPKANKVIIQNLTNNISN
ncbi:MAG: A/G-specific adenine glycosylase [Candidatus Margulisiibacteriota bacterium]